MKHPTIIDGYLKKEVDSSNILGPFPLTSAPAVHINHFGIIPKKHHPALCSLKYVKVEQVAEKAVLLGKGSLIAKIDVKSAYLLLKC